MHTCVGGWVCLGVGCVTNLVKNIVGSGVLCLAGAVAGMYMCVCMYFGCVNSLSKNAGYCAKPAPLQVKQQKKNSQISSRMIASRLRKMPGQRLLQIFLLHMTYYYTLKISCACYMYISYSIFHARSRNVLG